MEGGGKPAECNVMETQGRQCCGRGERAAGCSPGPDKDVSGGLGKSVLVEEGVQAKPSSEYR